MTNEVDGMQPNPIHLHSELSQINFNGISSQVVCIEEYPHKAILYMCIQKQALFSSLTEPLVDAFVWTEGHILCRVTWKRPHGIIR